jgi:hypothetical protein
VFEKEYKIFEADCITFVDQDPHPEPADPDPSPFHPNVKINLVYFFREDFNILSKI